MSATIVGLAAVFGKERIHLRLNNEAKRDSWISTFGL